LPPSSVSLAVLVQSHPKRAHLLPALTAALGECDVITDPEPDGPPSPIRCYLACLRAMPSWATHLLVVQDDARAPYGWRPLAEQAMIEKPEAMIALFLAGAPHKSAALARRAHARGERWLRMPNDDWTPTVALIWPRERVEEFLEFRGGYKGSGTGDDNVVGEYTKLRGVPVYATVPSIIDHPNIEPSLIGKKHGPHIRLRVAAVPPRL